MTKALSRLLLATALAGGALSLFATPSSAEVIYPWCALYSDRGGGGATNCGFNNRAQCMQSVSGVGGTCYQNPTYAGPPRARRQYRHRG